MSDLAGQHKEARSLILALRERVEQLEKTERVRAQAPACQRLIDQSVR